MRRGEIWIGNLNPNRGAETGKVRPVLIIQPDWLSGMDSSTVIVLPLTSDVQPELEPMRPVVRAREGLRTVSQVLVDKPRTLDRKRLGPGPVADLSPLEMLRVDQSLIRVLGLKSS